MSTLTTNLNLVKPDYTDYADINVINGNMDILDSEFSNLRNRYLPLTGGTLTGDLIGTNIKLSGRLTSTNTTGGMYINGGTALADGASLYAYGKDNKNNSGQLALYANDGSNSARFTINPNGNITTDKENFAIVGKSGGNLYITGSTVGLSNGKTTLQLNGPDNTIWYKGKRQFMLQSYKSGLPNVSITSPSESNNWTVFRFENDWQICVATFNYWGIRIFPTITLPYPFKDANSYMVIKTQSFLNASDTQIYDSNWSKAIPLSATQFKIGMDGTERCVVYCCGYWR